VGIGAAKRAGVRKLRRRNGYAPCAITGSGDVFRDDVPADVEKGGAALLALSR
jgi:hypothetical protein